MGIQFCIKAEEAGSLKVIVSGSRVELEGLGSGMKVAFEGGLDVTFSLVEEVLPPVQEEQSLVEAVAETQQEAAVEQSPASVEVSPELYTQLIELRRKISAEQQLPPYIIFHDTTLKDMCRLLPLDLQSLKGVQGVGEVKLEKYGSRFIEVIRKYVSNARKVA